MSEVNYECDYENCEEVEWRKSCIKCNVKSSKNANASKDEYSSLYMVKKNGQWYSVRKNVENGEYVGYLSEYYYGSSSIKEMIEGNVDLEFDYSQFVFDEEKGAYVYVNDEGTFSAYVFFVNGRLKRVEASVVSNTSMYYVESWTFVFKNINRTVVIVPKFSIE